MLQYLTVYIEYGPALPDTRLVHQASKVQTDSNEDSNGYTGKGILYWPFSSYDKSAAEDLYIENLF